MRRSLSGNLGGLLAVAALLPCAVGAQVVRSGTSEFERAVYASPDLDPPEEAAPYESVLGRLSPEAVSTMRQIQSRWGSGWTASFDPRSGALALAEGNGVPWIPGRGNTLAPRDVAAFFGGSEKPDLAALEAIARSYLPALQPLLRVDGTRLVLNLGRSGQVAGHLWFVDFDVVYGGIPVDGARVVFRVNNGNLVQFGAERIPAAVKAPGFPVARDRALSAVADAVGGLSDATDVLVDPGSPHLVLLGSAPGTDPGFGQGYRLVSVWQFLLRRKGVMGTWRARVNAATGELLEFVDANEYASAQVTGGVYPISAVYANETVMAMPFADATPPAGTYANSAGLYNYTSGTVTSTLNGQYVRITDNCGAISLSSGAPGNLAFGTSAGTDCTTPGSGGAGNTHAARSQFYHVNRIKEKGRGWLPGNTWLSQQLTVNVNLNQTCNAYWNGATLNFFRSGGGCGNTGEIAGVSLHEWGHGLDSNDGSGSSADNGTGETYGDWSAASQLHDSCIGPGFVSSNCGGYGNACTSCTGVRDIDWGKHARNTPSTVANFTSGCPNPSPLNPNYKGPCGKEGHCESLVSSEALWDFAARDLPNRFPGMSAGEAWNVADRLWYTSRATATGSAFTCVTSTTPWTSNGCGASSTWKVMRAVDDDDGNLANGTPHGCALYDAFNRHLIACTTDAGASLCYSACTAPAVPVLSATPSNVQVALSWTDSGAGIVYDVWRNEAGCGAGFTRIASNLATTSYLDTAVSNGTTYYYQVTAKPSGNDPCASAPSICQSATPAPCTTPGAPTIGTATASAANRITVTFAAGSPAPGTYSVYRAFGTCAAPGAFSNVAAGVAGSPWVDTSVSGGTTYAYRVTGVDATGGCESAPSGCADATATGACTLPPTFSGLTGVTNPQSATCGLTVSWGTAVPNCGGPVTFNVYRSTSAGFTPGPASLAASGLAASPWNDPGPLTSGTTYYYVVRAVDSSNSIEDGNTVQGSAAPTGPVSFGTWTDDGGDTGIASLSVQTTWTKAATGGNAGPRCYATGTYTANLCASATTPVLTVGAGGGTLTFYSKYDLESGWDKGQVELSTDGGVTWARLAITTYPAISNRTGDACGLPSGTRYFTGTSATYASFTGTIPAGSAIAVRWRLSSDGSVQNTGWWIDDISITNVAIPSACTSCSVPAAPGGVTATTTGCDGVTVGWNPVAGAASYDVVRGSACGTPVTTFSGVTSPYLDATAAAGTTYQYWVLARNSCGPSANSACAAGVRSLPAPAAPTGVTATTSSCGNVTVAWDPSVGASSYDVVRGSTCGTAVTTFSGATSPYVDATAAPGTAYQYWVVARNGCGASGGSACAAGVALPVLTAPTGVGAVASAPNQITVSWSAVSGADSYMVRRANGLCPGGSFTVVASGLTGTSFDDTTVIGGLAYAYEVLAVNGCGSAASACAGATASGYCTTPPTFAGLVSATAAAGPTCAVDLSWSAATSSCNGTLTYSVYRSAASGFTPGAANRIATGVTGTSFTDSSTLAASTTYYYVVRAVDGANGIEEGNTAERSASLPASCVTGAADVASFTATSTGDPGGGRNLLQWVNPASGPPGMTITINYRTDQYPAGPSDPAATVIVSGRPVTPGAADSYTHSGLSNATTYYYALWVRN